MADLKALMEDIARAIRLKTGVSDKINAQDFPQKIREIEAGSLKNTNKDLTIIVSKDIYLNIDTEKNNNIILSVPNKNMILDWSRRIICNSSYVQYIGPQYIFQRDTPIILSFYLWKNCELNDIYVYEQEKLIDIEYNYYFNEEQGLYQLDLLLNEINYNITVEINVNYTDEPIPPSILGYCDILDYIETPNTRNVYVNTGITPRTTLKATFIGHLLSTTARQTFFGTSAGTDGNGSARFSLYHHDSGAYNIYYYTGTANSWPYTNNYNITVKRTFVLDRYQLYIDNNFIGSSTSTNSTSDYPIYLFAWNGAGSPNTFGHIRCYGFSIEENNEKLIDLIPVYNKKDKKYGFYDYVTDSMFYGIGGDLIGGYDE